MHLGKFHVLHRHNVNDSEEDVLGPRLLKGISPTVRIIKLGMELWSEVLVRKIGWVIFLHKLDMLYGAIFVQYMVSIRIFI
jgi:hypothetical protein